LKWDTDLAHKNQIERRAEHSTNLGGNGYPTAWKRQDYRILVLVGGKRLGQLTACITAILEWHRCILPWFPMTRRQNVFVEHHLAAFERTSFALNQSNVNKNAFFNPEQNPPMNSQMVTWIVISLCVIQTGIFSGLNLALFSVSRLRLEVETAGGNTDAAKLFALRTDSNFTLATIIWGNVATNVVLTLLSESVLAGLGAFIFSTFVITLLGEIFPQAYFARNALRIAARFVIFLKFYQVILFIVAKPAALLLNWWLGPETIALFRERDFRILMSKHLETAHTDLGQLEAIGAVNFLDLDDISVLDEGEQIDSRSIVSLPVVDGRPVLPKFENTPVDPFLRQLDASGRKWVIFVDQSDRPCMVLDAHHFLRDVLFNEVSVGPEPYWHRPIVVTNMNARLGDVIGLMKMRPEHVDDDVIDQDLILIWGKQRRIITGADLLGRLLRGIVTREKIKVDAEPNLAR
jgi:hypothetical protein